MDCRYLEDIYELFMLGALDEEDSLQLRQHLAPGCVRCAHRLKEAARTVYLLSLSGKSVAPGSKVKTDLLRMLKNK